MATKINTALILGLTLLLADALAAHATPAPPSRRQEAAEESKPDVPPADGSGVTTGSKELPRSAPDSTDQKPAPPPMPPVRTVPAGSVPKDLETGQKEKGIH